MRGMPAQMRDPHPVHAYDVLTVCIAQKPLRVWGTPRRQWSLGRILAMHDARPHETKMIVGVCTVNPYPFVQPTDLVRQYAESKCHRYEVAPRGGVTV